MSESLVNRKNSEEKEAALQLQYKIAIDMNQSEEGRFWTRFNILVGIQGAGLIGVFSNLPILIVNIVLFRCVLIFGCGLSLFLILICIRGISSTWILSRLVFDIESRSDYLMSMLSFVHNNDRLPQYYTNIIVTSISVMLAVAWWGALVSLELIEYNIILPI